jgi:hypothetical protein
MRGNTPISAAYKVLAKSVKKQKKVIMSSSEVVRGDRHRQDCDLISLIFFP